MEMEYLNDNTMRIFIGADDLADRGFSLKQLLSNQESVERFFMSILKEADVSNRFEHSDALTFQVIPMHGGIDLYITRSHSEDGQIEREAIADILDTLETEATQKQAPSLSIPVDLNSDMYQLTVKFECLDHFITFAQNFNVDNIKVSLYRYSDSYYGLFELNASDYSEAQFQNIGFYILDYSDLTEVHGSVIREHGQLLMKDNAISLSRKLFSK